MIDADAFGLKDFSLVESVKRAWYRKYLALLVVASRIVYLGWAPHPMNSNVEMEYLSGGDASSALTTVAR